jgi:hypothetical protein
VAFLSRIFLSENFTRQLGAAETDALKNPLFAALFRWLLSLWGRKSGVGNFYTR